MLLHHLLDPTGFPVISKWGPPWDGWLIGLYVISRGLMLTAYLVFIGVFLWALRAAKGGHFNEAQIRIHMPRVLLFFTVSAIFDALLQALMIVAFWWPALRLIGVVAFLSAVSVFVSSLKSGWALTFCLERRGSDA